MNVAAKPFKQADFSLLDLVDDQHVKMAIKSNLTIIQSLNLQIDLLEKTVLQQLKLKPDFQTLLIIDGIGPILGMTIMLELGDIHRFPTVGNFASY